MSASPERTRAHAFSHHAAGVRIEGTHITCDAAGSASDLVFISHARAVGQPGRRRFPARRGGRQELLATRATLALMGRAGDQLLPNVLPSPFARSFVLGDLRLELVPCGHLPGAASLLCEVEGRRLLYAGTFANEGGPAFGSEICLVRRADAVCVDGTFGQPRFTFPPREQALAEVRDLVARALAAGRAPVLLVPPWGGGMDAAAALAADGIPLRGHRAVVTAASAFRAAGAPAPIVARFDRKLAPGEVLLWPPEARDAPMLGMLTAPFFALVSPMAVDAEARRQARAEAHVALANQAGHPGLLAYLEETGAREVAVARGHADELAEDLRARGYDAYALGPPRQMELLTA